MSLTDLIHQVHQQSRGTYGALRVHPELRLGHGIAVGHNAVAMLMRRAGLSGSRGCRRLIRPVDTPAGLSIVNNEPDRLWVTDVQAPRGAACTRGYFLGEPLHPQPAVRSPGTDQYSHQYVAMTVHAFVDESQRGRFYLVCAVEASGG